MYTVTNGLADGITKSRTVTNTRSADPHGNRLPGPLAALSHGRPGRHHGRGPRHADLPDRDRRPGPLDLLPRRHGAVQHLPLAPGVGLRVLRPRARRRGGLAAGPVRVRNQGIYLFLFLRSFILSFFLLGCALCPSIRPSIHTYIPAIDISME